MKIEPYGDQVRLAILLGIIAGIVCAVVKLGWEIPFPPRTPVRDATNPPQQILQQLGFSYQFTHLTYIYNQNARPIISFMMHFGFSITFTVLYCVIAVFWSGVTLWQGAAYGLFIWFAYHEVILPAAGTIPPPWHQPIAEHFSEITGHMLCFWVAELVRHDLHYRITNRFV